MKFVVLVAAIALLEYVYFGFQVGQARARYGVAAPAVTGNPIFERYHRVHQNTLENLVTFPFVRAAIETRGLELAGARYGIADGVLELLDRATDQFVPLL